MTLRNSFPGPSGITTTTDARIALGGLLEDYLGGSTRTGLFPSNLYNMVYPRSDMNVDIVAFQGVANQFGGPILIANDGTIQLPSVLVSPASGTNFYVVYVKQDESTSPGTDADNLVKVGAALSTVSFAAARALLPTGALELATVQVPTGVASTNAGGVTITQTFQYTVAEGGILPVRNGTELAAWTPADGSLAYQIDAQAIQERIGGAWVTASSVWQAYTPTWNAASTAPALGNGTLTARFAYLGPHTVAFRIVLVFGSTTNGGTGAWTFTLPSGILPASGEQDVFCKAYLAGPGLNYAGFAVLGSGGLINPFLPVSSSASNMANAQNASSGGAVSTGIPLVSGNYSFLTGSNIIIEGTFEIQ